MKVLMTKMLPGRILLPGLLLAFAALAVAIYGVIQVRADGPEKVPASGIICTENPTSTFTLTAKEGYISMTDGNVVFMWGYANGTDDFQFPGPILCVTVGDTVTVVLHNELDVDTSIMFPGQIDVKADGIPLEPHFDGSGNLISLINLAAANGGVVTYEFEVTEPGTHVYQSGTDPAVQSQMGLFGALVVRPADCNPDVDEICYAYDNPTTGFNPKTEYMMMLSEIDPLMHQAYERGETYDMSLYNPRYFLINGRTFPDTIAPNHASWLPNQPYSSLGHIQPFDEIENPLPALDRFIGMGEESYPFHPHAFNARVIARDARLLQGPNGEDMSEERFSIPVNPGQTSDALYQWEDVYAWTKDAGDLPVSLPNAQNLPAGLFYGSPFLGNQDVKPVGTTSFNQCGEFYHIAHNHSLQQITGWGVVLVGQVTFTRIDPPTSDPSYVNCH